MRFARWVFLVAGGAGLLAILPLYALEGRIGRDLPPAITHPELLYGFAGVTFAWQVAFLVIGSDPARYRPMMLVGVLEKVSYGVASVVLFALGRAAAPILASGLLDLAFGVLFLIAHAATAPRRRAPS